MTMNTKLILILGAAMLPLFLCGRAPAGETQGQVVRVAKLEIDPAQLQTYKAALKKEIETSVRVEPGVLVLYAVAEKDNSARITVFEIYANPDPYNPHLETPHFKKYKTATQTMVKSLQLLEAAPIVLAAKRQ